ncbi:ZRSR2 family protein [Megaselia abdita]
MQNILAKPQENSQLKRKSHKQWRKEVKKLRRKKIRQKEAQTKPMILEDIPLPDSDDSIEPEDSEQRLLGEELWLRRELIAQKVFREQKRKKEEIEAVKKAEKDKIQREFELREQRYQDKINEKKRLEEEAQREWDIVQEQLTNFLENKGRVPEKLLVPLESNPGKEECSFFLKTNCCRHDLKCLRNHKRPQISKVLLLKNFYSHISLERAETGIEFTYHDVLNDYYQFFEDISEELEKFGEIINIRTCGNTGIHMRGNVFVEFESMRNAMNAYINLNGRFYAGKQINAEFSTITSWKAAVCGLALHKKCHKGGSCNFLHLFPNPRNKYSQPCKGDGRTDSIRSHKGCEFLLLIIVFYLNLF